ncbi:MAG: ATP-dependent 6-phosphofructokinase [Phycisphaerae bacterium]|nr:ATP-dependent 6-phosphofructokinase [Phycisphaerae bacterium]
MRTDNNPLDFRVAELGPRRVASPYRTPRYVSDGARTLLRHTVTGEDEGSTEASQDGGDIGFELAGPREQVYFDPSKTRCGIVTCGGLCPGLNDVIRAIVLQLHEHYGVELIYGFRYGFEGLVARYGHRPIMLDPETVAHIHQRGGTILSSSRGPQEPAEMVDALERLNLQMLFCIGGDGTFRGADALCREIERRGLKIAVVSVPKTIDNDIPFTTRTFGFETAFSEASLAIRAAHVEATGALNGVGLVKLMGRHAGFIAAHAALASRDADFVLVPEVEFELAGSNGLFSHLARQLKKRRHAVVVVAEGAGQRLFESDTDRDAARDPSGNIKLKDIGTYLRDRIGEYLRLMSIPHTLKYIDPSYLIRSAPATPSDSLFAGILGQMAAHAAMAGKTGMFVGHWNDQFTHVPISAAVANSKRLDPTGHLWQSVVECTGQPTSMINSGNVEEDSVCDWTAAGLEGAIV